MKYQEMRVTESWLICPCSKITKLHGLKDELWDIEFQRIMYQLGPLGNLALLTYLILCQLVNLPTVQWYSTELLKVKEWMHENCTLVLYTYESGEWAHMHAHTCMHTHAHTHTHTHTHCWFHLYQCGWHITTKLNTNLWVLLGFL